jgi:hypothetical protein
VRRLAPLVVLAALVLAGCGHTDRPEGAVERWLTSLNQGAAGRPGRYAGPAESNEVLPGWRGCDPGALDTIEVGNSIVGGAPASSDAAFVPFRVEYATDVADLCPGSRPHVDSFAGTVTIAKTGQGPLGDEWRVVHLERVPGAGPLTPARQGVSVGVWAVGLLVGLLLCGMVALLMRAMPRPAPVSSEPIDPSEARGL